MATHIPNDTTASDPVALARAVRKQVGDGRRDQTLPFPRHARTRVMPTAAGADLIVTDVTRAWARTGGGWSTDAAALAGKLAEIARRHDGVSVLIDFGDGGPRPFEPSGA